MAVDATGGRHPLRPRVPPQPPEHEPAPTSVEALAREVPFAAQEMEPVVAHAEALGRRLGLRLPALLENLRFNLLGFEDRVGASAHFLDVGAARQRSADLWAYLIDALEDGDADRLRTIVEGEPDGRVELENLLLHYRFVFDPDVVTRWTALATDLILLTDRDFARADLFRALNRLDLTDHRSERRFIELAEIGLSAGVVGPDELEALIAAHAARRLERGVEAAVDGGAVREATVSAIRAGQTLGALPSFEGTAATVLLVESIHDEASHVSMRQKGRLFRDLGIEPRLKVLPHDIDVEALRAHIDAANRDPSNLATIVQLPIAPALRPALQSIAADKDLDGLSGGGHRRSATAEAAIRTVADRLAPGDAVLVIGGDGFTGRQIADGLTELGLRAVRYDQTDAGDARRDRGLADSVRDVKAVISAANAPHVLNGEWCARYGLDPDALEMIVDVGFNVTPRSQPAEIRGSVAPPIRRSTTHTPVPGGAGPLEMAVLAERLASARAGRPLQIWRIDADGRPQIRERWARGADVRGAARP